MRRVRLVAGGLVAALAVLVTGCAHKNYVVLLDDGSGRPSAVVVTTAGGTQEITETWHGCEIEPGDVAPGAPFVVEEAEVRREFGAAIDAQPPPPVHFTLYFESDGTKLTAESEAELPRVLEAIRSRPTADASAIGHADRMGDDAYNDRLARRRAEAIRERLVAMGVAPALVEATSHGENDPLVKTPDGTAEPRNRRVEVIVR